MSQYLMVCPNCIVKEIYPSHTDTQGAGEPHIGATAGAPAVVDKRGHGLGPKGYGALVAGFTKRFGFKPLNAVYSSRKKRHLGART